MSYKNWTKEVDERDIVTYASKEDSVTHDTRSMSSTHAFREVVIVAEKENGTWKVKAVDRDTKPMSGWAKVQRRTNRTVYTTSQNTEQTVEIEADNKAELISGLSDYLESTHPDEVIDSLYL